jgi:hypothetical protein
MSAKAQVVWQPLPDTASVVQESLSLQAVGHAP